MTARKRRNRRQPSKSPPDSVDDEALARGVAAICGPHSGAARALAELDARRASGKAAHIARVGNTWLVCDSSMPPGVD